MRLEGLDSSPPVSESFLIGLDSILEIRRAVLAYFRPFVRAQYNSNRTLALWLRLGVTMQELDLRAVNSVLDRLAFRTCCAFTSSVLDDLRLIPMVFAAYSFCRWRALRSGGSVSLATLGGCTSFDES